jgi:hypothetical protein
MHREEISFEREEDGMVEELIRNQEKKSRKGKMGK